MKCSDLKQLKLDESGKIGYTFKTLGSGFWALKQNDFRKAITKIVLQVDMLIFDILWFIYKRRYSKPPYEQLSPNHFPDITSRILTVANCVIPGWHGALNEIICIFVHVLYELYHLSIYVYISCNIRTFLPLDINFPETHSLYLFRGVLI